MKRKDEITIADLTLPSTEKIERQVLGELMLRPSEIREARNIIGERHFHDAQRAKAFGVMCALAERGEPIDYVTVGERVGHDWVMKEFVTDAAQELNDSAVLKHCYILKEGYLRREAYMMAARLLQQSARPDAEVENIIGIIDDFKKTVTEATQSDSTVTLEKALFELSESLTTTDNHITTGFPLLDDLTFGGFDGGQLIILAARPSVGKTAVALFMALQASKTGKKAQIFSIEMTRQQLAKRYLFAEGTISAYDLTRRTLDWAEFNRIMASYADSGIYINDKLNSIDGIVGEIIRQHTLGQLDIAYIDYLGLIREVAQTTERKVGTIGIVTARLKEVAKSLGIPIVLLCQLNRNSVQNGVKRAPVLADLRDSGSIEQDADIVLMLEPKTEVIQGFADEMPREVDKLNMWVRKNREGKREVAVELETNQTHTTYEQIGLITE